MKKISVVTLGCKVNQYDTAALLNHLPSSEFVKNKKFDEPADVYVIDTCTVTHKADSEARNYIYRAKRSNPRGVVIVTGCYAQVSPEQLSAMGEVDYVIGNSHKFSSLLGAIRRGEVQSEPKVLISDIFKEKKRKFDTPDIRFFPDRTRAFLKVQDGCNYACTFCVIPRARGRSRSLGSDEVISRLRTLARGGYKEVVLTGVHLASYGRDIGSDLVSLLGEIEKSGTVGRIRLSSLDPADTTEELIRFVSDSKVICPSFHVALQSGDTDVLRRMRRRYSPEQFLKCTDSIRSTLPEASIGTDIMVGFPGETQEQFENSRDVAAASELTYFHVFPYSIRKMTPAANMKDQISPQVKKERSVELRTLGKTKKEDFYRKFIGKTLDAIVENKSNCTTKNYINVKLTEGSISTGTEIKVRIREVKNEIAYATAV
ncbi:MAG: tRNA (N(6)-L-threonylcarbamoyladenosine(37)-C(2))-methylthiotransferase MtaB [Candidatus Dadabacteria bacterium]|nr:tRNA (N(6)-L-threonylcarbamoyladenosine(37)-C(2))-methylthiotransferase MtaB [Candidatus Dadabacteria bacterium]MYA49048.1 tRNA (N(6)-L-threonylcarbamoyladenosine(37)-C(2))-methylthiotransferase MtaB [Candidatus Dadabacteria bacterium]MYF48172.1 tRNA (N(6)-L-threonylcarbamoyladenosine(37)-C(2))-methylthiotransferase MtaB [Candidatus Dadabacteria bacterium]MYG83195.1 tRNA (N(6)-L-threonylcarbamoyladenosine(37)-C(2))-methylthiotransferase MtaB [Candidatus Dadabacteria bacterium]MYK50069.1 tRNA